MKIPIIVNNKVSLRGTKQSDAMIKSMVSFRGALRCEVTKQSEAISSNLPKLDVRL